MGRRLRGRGHGGRLRGLGGDEGGYTIVELAAVLLIMSILLAIAVATYVGATQRAKDVQAQASLRNALMTARVYFLDDASYTSFTATAAESMEPSLDWASAGDPPTGTVAILDAADGVLQMVIESSTGTFFCLREDASVLGIAQVTYGSGLAYADVDEPTECDDPLGW